MSGSSESNFDNDNLIEELLIVPGIDDINHSDGNNINEIQGLCMSSYNRRKKTYTLIIFSTKGINV